MKINSRGEPENSIMKIRQNVKLENENSKVKYHPQWANTPKPWSKYPISKSRMLASVESHFLYEKAKELGNGNYANLGVFKGLSVAALACGLKEENYLGKIYAVDTFNPEVTGLEDLSNMVEGWLSGLNLNPYVEMCIGFTHEWAGKLKDKTFKFVFIDADHHYETCKMDFEMWSPMVEVGGEVAFHDCNMNTVDRVIKELPPGWQEIAQAYRIRSFKKL